MTARRIRLEDIANGKYHQQEGFEPNYLITPRGVRVSRILAVATVVDSFVNDDETYGALTIDDGTETIRLKMFQDLEELDGLEEGDMVKVVGKVREYEDEIYIQPELLQQAGVKDELLYYLETKQIHDEWQEAIDKAQEMQDSDRSDEDILQELQGMGLEEEDAEAIIEYLSVDQQFDTGQSVDSPQATVTERGQRSQRPQTEDESEDDNVQQEILELIDELDSGDGADYTAIIGEADRSEDEVEDAINDLLSDGTCYEPKPGRIKKL